jgi:hypothetical protein
VSYLNTRKASCAWVEFTQSSAQTISSGTDITWDTKRTTGGDNISYNSSTGVITLDSSKRYWIQATINVVRNGNGNIGFEFKNGAGGSLTQAQGNFPMLYVEDTSNPYINSSFVSSLVVSYPTITYKLVCTQIDQNSTLASQSHLFIMELK